MGCLYCLVSPFRSRRLRWIDAATTHHETLSDKVALLVLCEYRSARIPPRHEVVRGICAAAWRRVPSSGRPLPSKEGAEDHLRIKTSHITQVV
jgi:hypothetical protein